MDKFDLWQQEQESYQKWKELKKRQRCAKIAVQKAYEKEKELEEKVDLYREILKHEKEIIRHASSEVQVYWDEYKRILSKNDPAIEKLKAEANQEFFKMQNLLKSINRKNSTRTEDDLNQVKIHEHNRDEINAKVRVLKDEILKAKRQAKEADAQIDRSGQKEAEVRLKQAETKYKEARKDYADKKEQKELCDRLRYEAEAEYKRIKKELQDFINYLQPEAKN